MSRGDALARLRQELEDHGCTIRGTSAQCPAHDDRNPSLSITQGRDGAVLKCHGGCETDAVLEVLGLRAADLFDEPHGNGGGYQVTATYPYTDEHGTVLYYAERRFPKDFRQYHIENGTRKNNLNGTRRVLYQLPRVLEAVSNEQLVYVVEGEKDVHAIEAAGGVATCNPMGAGKWRPEYGDMLKGALVLIVADRDPAGYAHAAAVKADLDGKAAAAIILQAAEGNDVSDHLAAGRPLADLVPVAAESPPATHSADTAVSADTARRLVLTPASAIAPEPVVWAWEDDEGHGRIPAGSLGLFAGREGTGKSSFLIWMTAKLTTGKLRGSFGGRPRAVIYVAVEDSWKYTIVPRLLAAGADLNLVYRAEVHVTEDEAVSLSLPADNKMLEEAITTYGVAMVALDPLMSAISDSLDTHVNRQVRQALDPLARLADRTGALIAGIAHFNKSSSTDASSLITASGAFKDVARFIFGFATDPEDGSQVITQTKNSLGLSNLPSFAYRIIEATVDTAKGPARVGRLMMDGPSERTVQDILSVKPGGEERDEKTRAENFLKSTLGNGPRPTREVVEESKQVHAIAPRTLNRARLALHLPTAKRADGWWLSLPEHEGDLRNPQKAETLPPAKTANSANPASPGDVGSLGSLESSDAPDCGHCDGTGYCPLPSCQRCGAGTNCASCGGTGSRP